MRCWQGESQEENQAHFQKRASGSIHVGQMEDFAVKNLRSEGGRMLPYGKT
jgi:hypothetical protein